jgi:paraquat-inducible protein B
VDRAVGGPELPHALAQLARTLDEVHGLAQEARAGLAPALERLPGIAQHVDEAVTNANQAIASVGSADGEFQRSAQRLLVQATDMARSVRLLAEFLERHPEALLRGRGAANP